jgi:hypothetical protein
MAPITDPVIQEVQASADGYLVHNQALLISRATDVLIKNFDRVINELAIQRIVIIGGSGYEFNAAVLMYLIENSYLPVYIINPAQMGCAYVLLSRAIVSDACTFQFGASVSDGELSTFRSVFDDVIVWSELLRSKIDSDLLDTRVNLLRDVVQSYLLRGVVPDASLGFTYNLTFETLSAVKLQTRSAAVLVIEAIEGREEIDR